MKGTKNNLKKITEICKGKAEVLSCEESPKNNLKGAATILKAKIKVGDTVAIVDLERGEDLVAFERLMADMSAELLVVSQINNYTDKMYTVLNLTNVDNSFTCTRKFLNSLSASPIFKVLNVTIRNEKFFYDYRGEEDDKILKYKEENDERSKLFYFEIKKINGIFVVTDVVSGRKFFECNKQFPVTKLNLPDWVDYVLLTKDKRAYSLKDNEMKNYFEHYVGIKNYYEVVTDRVKGRVF